MLKGKGILSAFQKEVLHAFVNLPDSNRFYLTGGTALAEFYFGHRLSFDLDLFTSDQPLISPFSRLFELDAVKFLPPESNVKSIRRFATFAECEVGNRDEKVRVQFAYDSPFQFQRPEESEFGVMVNNVEDIYVDKLLAFYGRAEARDAVDLFFILKTRDPEELFRLAAQKDPGFDLYWFAVALEKVRKFPDEMKRWPVTMLANIDALELKASFAQLSIEILNKIRPRS